MKKSMRCNNRSRKWQQSNNSSQTKERRIDSTNSRRSRQRQPVSSVSLRSRRSEMNKLEQETHSCRRLRRRERPKQWKFSMH